MAMIYLSKGDIVDIQVIDNFLDKDSFKKNVGICRES